MELPSLTLEAWFVTLRLRPSVGCGQHPNRLTLHFQRQTRVTGGFWKPAQGKRAAHRAN